MHKNIKSKGFTIVELLVVIVVIGILAVVTVIGYTGVTQRAAAAALESDLKTASTQLELYKVENGEYPAEGSATVIGLPSSDGTDYQYSLVDGQYYLSATSDSAGTTAYHISSTSGTIIAGVWENHTVPGSLSWEQVSVGEYHSCAISNEDKLYCWGNNGFGELGDNSTDQRSVPVAVDMSGALSGKTILSVTTGLYHTCAVASDNNAYCWGVNYIGGGQLGTGLDDDSIVPVAVDTTGALSGKTIKALSAGFYHTCAIASDDKVYCWGFNSDGQLGNDSTTNTNAPVAVDMTGALSGKTIKSIEAGRAHTCAIASDDKAYCWGINSDGQLGINSISNSNVPVAVNTDGVLSGKTIKSIAANQSHTCAIASDDKAYCWGDNENGRLGDGTTTVRLVPVAVDMTGALSGKTIKSIANSTPHTCVVASDNLAYCWGYNEPSGQLGDGTTTSSSVPVLVSMTGALNGKTIKNIGAGMMSTTVIASDNQIYSWGYNGLGQLGNGTIDDSLIPVALSSI